MSNKHADDIMALRRQGRFLQEIADETDCSYRHVRRVLRDIDGPRQPSMYTALATAYLLQTDLIIAEIARRSGMLPQRVQEIRRRLIELGFAVPARPSGRSREYRKTVGRS